MDGEKGSALVRWSKIFGVIVVLILILWLLLLIRGILVPFIISLLLAYVLGPVVDAMERKGMGRVLAILIIYVVFASLVAVGIMFLLPKVTAEFNDLRANYLGYVDRFQGLLESWQASLQEKFSVLQGQDLVAKVTEWAKGALTRVINKTPALIINLFSLFSIFVLVPFVTFFFLKDGRKIRKSLIALVPNRYFEISLNLVYKIDQQLGGYIRGQLIDAAIVGALSIVGLLILNIKYYFAIGILAGLANLIPYFGPIVGAVPAMVVAFIQFNGFTPVLMVVALFAIVQLLDNVLISPLVVAKSVNLHPLVVILVVLVGSQLMGLLGMLLAVPVTGVIKVTVQELYRGLKSYAVA